MTRMVVCASHSPLIDFPGRVTPTVSAARASMAEQAAAIQAFDPELVLLFGTDHYGGQQMACMPCFCIGRAATALADVGGTPGRLEVPAALAAALLAHVRAEGIDAAWSHEMEVDHGFSQALAKLCGGIDRFPVVPIFIDAIAPPFVPFARSRRLGAAVGAWARGRPERILVLGTGGLSHHPAIFFPPVEQAPDELQPYLVQGERQSQMPRSDWMARIDQAHRDVAPHLASDQVELEQIHIHEDWDRAFLELLVAGALETVDDWQPEDIAERIGIGTVEVHSWIAACACARAAGCEPPEVGFYAPIREYGVGFGLLHGAKP
jgi:2,3-dihydroxyphenylpropionate 1,2-dioxygenase